MHVIYLILFVAALVLFLLDTFNTRVTRFNPVAAGLACIAAAFVLQTVNRL